MQMERRQKKGSPNPDKEDSIKTNWKKELIKIFLPALLAFAGGICIVHLAPKQGKLIVFCNTDSAGIYINEDFLGITKYLSTDIDSLAKFEMSKIPMGTYIIRIQKKGFYSKYTHEVRIEPRSPTTVFGTLIPLHNQDTVSGSLSPNRNNVIHHESPGIRIELPDNSDTLANRESSVIRTFRFWVSGEIDIKYVSLFVEDQNMGTPPNNKFTVDLKSNQQNVTLIYMPSDKKKYQYTINCNLAGTDLILVTMDAFKPL